MTLQRLKIILPLLLLLLGTVSAWAIMAFRPQIVPEPPIKQLPTVSVLEVNPETVKLTVLSQGVVTPQQEIDLIPEVTGKIIKLHPQFVTGGFFTRNEVLLEIDPRDYEHALIQAHAQISEANRQLAMEEAQAEQARTEWEALGEGAPTALALRQPQLAEAKAKLKAAEANLRQAQIKLSRCRLYAPFNGIFQTKAVGLGQFVQPGDKLAHLYATHQAEVRLPIALEQLAFVNLPFDDASLTAKKHRSPFPKVELSAELAGKRYHWQGTIVRTEGKVDDHTGVIMAVAEVTEPYHNKDNQLPLMNGLFVQATITGNTVTDVFALPPLAVNAEQQVLIVDAKQTIHIQPVKILRTEAERVLIASGLKPGDRVVLAGLQLPVEGMAVNIEPKPKTPIIQ